MKKQKKLVRKKSLDQSELNIACRDLGKADFEGWLQKKSGGHGLVPVSWKRYWCVMKTGKLYCYKTSFDIAADYSITVKSYTVEKTEEKKKKIAFKLVPASEDFKQAVFAGDSEEDVNAWVELINKVLSGIDVSKTNDDKVPEYEERHRMYSTNLRTTDESVNNARAGSVRHKQRMSSAFAVETETTGMPAGFGARTQSTSQPRVRKMSSGGAKPESCLAVGSMFKSLDVEEDEPGSPEEDANLKGLLFREVEVEAGEEVIPQGQSKEVEIAKLNAEIAKLNDDMLVLNKDGERKSTELPETVESPKPVEVPTVQVEMSADSEPVTDAEKVEVNEDSLEVSGKLTAQERSTSQIFRDFEAATADDPVPTTEEIQAEVKVEKPTKINVSIEQPESPIVQPKERPPAVEEDDIVETRKSTEIDAETVITELEQQQKKEEQQQQQKDDLSSQDDNEVIVTDIPMNIVPEDEDDAITKMDKESEDQEETSPLEIQSSEQVTEQPKATEVVEAKKPSTPETSVDTREVDVSIETSTPNVSVETTEVVVSEEISTPEVSVETPEVNVSEARSSPVVSVETPEVVEPSVATPEADVSEETFTSKPVVAEPEADVSVELSTSEESVQDVSVESSTSEESVQDVSVESPTSEESVQAPKPEEEQTTSEVVVSEELKTPETETTEETTEIIDEQSQADNMSKVTTVETTTTTKTDDGETVEITIETTETIIVDDNNVSEITIEERKPKACSVDLGEDLELPTLNDDTSLSDEINIQLNSPTTLATEQSFTLETNKAPQVNGDATHAISVN